MLNRQDRIRGALYGVACGDALGGPLEFMTREQVLAAHPAGLRDMIGGGWLDLQPGETTDDTAMTLAVAWGLIEGKTPNDQLTCIGQRFIDWFASDPPDVGGTCRASILVAQQHIRNGMQSPDAWIKAAADVGGGYGEGNGALMRSVYPGLYCASEYDASDMAERAARLTHDGPLNRRACAWYAGEIWRIVEYNNAAERFSPVLLSPPFNPQRPLSACASPSGYVVDTLNAALAALRETSTAEDAIVTAANLGGDADTVAAICGGLAGAMYGFSALPARWVSRLDPELSGQLDELAARACERRKI